MKTETRRALVAEILSNNPNTSIREMATRLNVSPATIKRDKKLVKETISEMIGRTSLDKDITSFWRVYQTTVDRTKVDYEFWGKFRRGKAKGYEIGGLFGRPIGEIMTFWALGTGYTVTVDGNENHESLIADFTSQQQDTIFDWYFDSLTLGDSYLVVNPDASLTQVQPNQVAVKTNELDFRQVEAYTILNRLEKATITDEYRLDGRTVTLQRDGISTQQPFTNLIERFPVIHLPNDREANEVYGHPVYEALLTLFAEYDDVLRKSLDGVKVMGHPIPVAENLEEPEEALALNATDEETWVDESGVTQTRKVVDFTQLSMLFFGKGGKFHFAQPGAFTQDAGRMLEYLFLLMMQHSKIPEWAWGGAIASSKASVEAQMPAFELFVQALRKVFEPYLINLIQTWAAMKALTDPAYAGIAEADVKVEWNQLTPDNMEVVLKWTQFLLDRGLLTNQTAVEKSGLVDDAANEVEQAQAEQEERQEAEEERIARLSLGQVGEASQRFNSQQQPNGRKEPAEAAA